MERIFCAKRTTRSEAFRRACERNALRRESKLPLLSVTEAVKDELRRDAIRIHYAAAEHYRAVHDEIKAQVIADLRAERGQDFGMSTGGHWIITLHTNREFATFLACLGFARPPTALIPYGSKRAAAASHRESASADLSQLADLEFLAHIINLECPKLGIRVD